MRRPAGRSDIVEIECEVRAETERAIQIFDGKTTCWLPRSQVEIGDDGTVAMPFWLAHEKGLL